MSLYHVTVIQYDGLNISCVGVDTFEDWFDAFRRAKMELHRCLFEDDNEDDPFDYEEEEELCTLLAMESYRRGLWKVKGRKRRGDYGGFKITILKG